VELEYIATDSILLFALSSEWDTSAGYWVCVQKLADTIGTAIAEPFCIGFNDTTGTIIDKSLIAGDISISAFPNPFNSSCRISINDCGLPITGIEIFDISGRKVAQFPLNDGIDEIVWDASTQPSGLYFCRACPHDAIPPVKLLLMK